MRSFDPDGAAVRGHPDDCAAQIVHAIVEDLSDRRGLRQEWEQIDEDLRRQIVGNWTKLAGDHLKTCHRGSATVASIRDGIAAVLLERTLYIVKPQQPTMGEVALEAYGFGKAADAVALQGDDLQALLTEIGTRCLKDQPADVPRATGRAWLKARLDRLLVKQFDAGQGGASILYGEIALVRELLAEWDAGALTPSAEGS